MAAASGCASLQPPRTGNSGKQEINPCRAPLPLSDVPNNPTKPRQSPPAPAQQLPPGWSLFPAADSAATAWRFLQPPVPQLGTPCPTRAAEMRSCRSCARHSPGS